MTEKEIKQMQAEIERLKADNERLHSEMIRLVSRNLDLSERLEADVELRRRTEVARTLMKENVERQRNADLQDDSQLLAILDLRLEEKRYHLNPDFDSRQLAELLGISQERRCAPNPTTASQPLPRHRVSTMCAPCSAASWTSPA